MKKAEKAENPLLGFEGTSIDLIKFNIKTEQDQYQEVDTTLQNIYQDSLSVNKNLVHKCIRLTCNPKDDYIYLPHNLKVSKEKLTLKFTYERKKPLGFGYVILAFWALVFALAGATYAGFAYLSIADLNKDIYGDGVRILNVDINNDRQADLNIDTKGDNKPHCNIDYRGNRKAMFNIDVDETGACDVNPVIDMSEPGAVCTLNCDYNGDGWPDANIDLDGDGKPDLNLDGDGDGVPDLNIDINGDGKCDIMCDEDGDGKCDNSCIPLEDYVPEDEKVEVPTTTTKPNIITKEVTTTTKKDDGSVSNIGDPDVSTATPSLIINYIDGLVINVSDLMPDDQDDYVNLGGSGKKPLKEFIIENQTPISVKYSLKWNVVKNTFTSNNLEFRLTATNGGYNVGYQTLPKTSQSFIQDITIPALASQKYTIEINLRGTGQPQNEDQGKVFAGYIEVILQ